jgi:hypothetical protein
MHTKSATPHGKPPGEDIVSKDGMGSRVSGLLAAAGRRLRFLALCS